MCPYYVQLSFLAGYVALFANVQIATRLLSSCPALFWFLATQLLRMRKDGSTAHDPKLAINLIHRAMVGYCLVYCGVGSVLFCNFLPWT
mmetsp:Transcript_12804/g.20129  ORF Transcript_12804/g.20129 Transcript_12804/m.20129 type:complete len:89 (-) Transcript_12804:176-442(-)